MKRTASLILAALALSVSSQALLAAEPAPEAILDTKGGKVKAVRASRMKLGEPDASGRQTPQEIPNSHVNIEADLVLKALGFDPENLLIDPYGLALAMPEGYRRGRDGRCCEGGWQHAMKSVVADPHSFDWKNDQPLQHPARETVIYELHVRDFSIGDTSVPPALRGTYGAFTQAGSQGMRAQTPPISRISRVCKRSYSWPQRINSAAADRPWASICTTAPCRAISLAE